LNGRNAPLAEINKNSGDHQKNFNEDRPISLVAKYRPMRILARNIIKCMQICAGFHRRGASCLKRRGHHYDGTIDRPNVNIGRRKCFAAASVFFNVATGAHSQSICEFLAVSNVNRFFQCTERIMRGIIRSHYVYYRCSNKANQWHL